MIAVDVLKPMIKDTYKANHCLHKPHACRQFQNTILAAELG